jgi:hypothetical protein
MKTKSILLTALATISLATATMAQVPNYVPTNGLLGWWPFNGNANDESGNGLNGSVNGATLTSDRNGNANKAYSFDGTDDYILVPPTNLLSTNSNSIITISYWVNSNVALGTNKNIFNLRSSNNSDFASFWNYPNDERVSFNSYNMPISSGITFEGNATVVNGNWYHLVGIYDYSTNIITMYLNGNLISTTTYGTASIALLTTPKLTIGARNDYTNSITFFFNGKIDDFGIWNRALTQQEITDLYNGTNCSNNTAITPQVNSLQTGSTAIFTATTSDPSPSYVWQSDFGQGFQTLNNFGNYSGVNTANLNIANVQLSNHNQPIRVITTSGSCIDTSNVAVINILDTCLTTVTDTLVINATITGLTPPNNLNTIKVFPNPAKTHITINYGNFASMSGYTLNIVNAIGQTVFTTPINQQTSYIDLSTWTGNGIYFVQIIDPQNNMIENRKIVIQ